MPDFEFENKYSVPVVGIDEAGRGPWAGPVVAGAVIIKDKITKTANNSIKVKPFLFIIFPLL